MPNDAVHPPLPPMSQALLDYAAPLLELAREHGHDAAPALIEFARERWNATGSPLAARPDDGAIAELAERHRLPEAALRAAVAAMDASRRTEFAHDRRVFTSARVTRHDGALQVRVEGLATQEPVETSVVRPLDPVEQFYFDLIARDGFSTGSLLQWRKLFGPPLAGGLLEGFLSMHEERPEVDEVWHFAAVMAFLLGPEATRQAVAARYEAAADRDQRLLRQMLSALGADALVKRLFQLPRSVIDEAARTVVTHSPPGPEGVERMLLSLRMTVAAGQKPLYERIDAHLADEDERIALAAAGVFSTLEEGARQAMAEAIARLERPEAGAFLAALTPDRVGEAVAAHARRLVTRRKLAPASGVGPDLPGSPLSWPARGFVSAVDGTGSQLVYVVRDRPDDRVALFGAVVSDWRGLVDDMAEVSLTRAEWAAMRERITGPIVEVGVGHAVARLREGEALCEREGLPMPLYYLAHRYALAGLAPEPASAARARAETLADRSLLGHTGALLHAVACRSWALTSGGLAEAEFLEASKRALANRRSPSERRQAFPEAIAAELDAPYTLEISERKLKDLERLITEHLAAVFDADARSRLSGRLLETMRVLEAQGKPQLARLAATAAIALGSGEVVEEVALLRDVMRRSAVWRAEQPW